MGRDPLEGIRWAVWVLIGAFSVSGIMYLILK